jgi:hypothetical protein
MILAICRWADALDEWLQSRLGRPYNLVLGIGLVTEIIGQIGKVGSQLGSAPHLARTIVILAIEFALLLHQLGALSHHLERRKAMPGLVRGRNRNAGPREADRRSDEAESS